MRISDWSSDVCSSDLREDRLALVPLNFPSGRTAICHLRRLREVDRANRTGQRAAIGAAIGNRRARLIGPRARRSRKIIARRAIIDRGSRRRRDDRARRTVERRSEEHTSELQSLMRISYAVFCLKKKKKTSRNL